MPLLEVQQSEQISAMIRLDRNTAKQVDQYAHFIHASADNVIGKALEYVFSKDRDFQTYLSTEAAAKAPQSLRLRGTPNGRKSGRNGS
jgi:hypothetical protein